MEKWQIITGTVTSTPIVASGNVYFADWNWSIYSANVLTGAPNWRVNVGNIISSTLCLYNGTLYAGYGLSGTSGVIAINEYTGQTLWNKVIAPANKQVWASPIVYDGMVYIGATGDEDTNSSTGGTFYALNANTGNLVWSVNTMIGTSGGAPVWGTAVVDPKLNSIYFGTGNSYVNASPSNSLYSYSIMSLNATNGGINWYYQIYPNFTSGQDNDFGSTPNLFSIKLSGVTYNAIGLGNKNGKYYILNRYNGELLKIFSIESRHVYTGIIGLAGFVYPNDNLSNLKLFIPSYYRSSSANSIVEALYPSNDVSPWKFYTPGIIDGSVSEVPGAVIFGDSLGNIYVLNMTTGYPILHKEVNGSILAGITPAEGFLFVPLTVSGIQNVPFNGVGGLAAFTLATGAPKANPPVHVWSSSEWPTVSPYSDPSRICYNVSKSYIGVNESWCQNGNALYQSLTSSGWKTLLLNYTNTTNFDMKAHESILSGENLRFLIDYNSLTGNFYSLALSRPSNSIAFETWQGWNRTAVSTLASNYNVSNGTVELIRYNGSTSISINGKFLAKINSAKLSNGYLGVASESASVALTNLTARPVVPYLASNVTKECSYVSSEYIALNPTWCQNGDTLYQSNVSGGWKILLLNYTNSTNFDMKAHESILSGENLRFLVDYNSTTGNFYSLTLSRPSNSIAFETWQDWNRTAVSILASNYNVSNGTAELIGYKGNTSISINGKFLAKINSAKLSNGYLGVASESASVALTNLTARPVVPYIASNVTKECSYVSSEYIALNPTWCQNGDTLYQSNVSGGWKILLLNYTNYTNFDMKVHESILSGENLRFLVDYNSTTGNFYSLTLSRPSNSIAFETWQDWNRTAVSILASNYNVSNGTVELIGYNKNLTISANGRFIAKINDTKYQYGRIGFASESASVALSNLTISSSVQPPSVGGFQASDIILVLGYLIVFALMVIVKDNKYKKWKKISLLDFILVLVTTLPVVFFLLSGFFPGAFFITYVLYLYVIYLLYSGRIGFDTNDLQKKVLIIVAALILQAMIAPLDWYIVESLKGSQLLFLAGTYDNLLFFKLEPLIWLLFSFMYFLGSKKNIDMGIKIFIVGILVSFSSVEDFLYYILSGTALPIQFPWITTVVSLLGSPLTQAKLLLWLGLMLVLSLLVMLLPIGRILKRIEEAKA